MVPGIWEAVLLTWEISVPENKRLYQEYLRYIARDLNFSGMTCNYYRYVLGEYIRYLKGKDLRDITLQDVSEYISSLKNKRTGNPLTVASQNTVRCILRSFFQYCDRYRGLRMRFDYSMIRQARAPRPQIQFLSLDKALEIIRKAPTPQDRLILITLFSTGMRIGEVVNFQVKDFRGKEILVRGKGGKDRTIPIDGELSKALVNHMHQRRILTGPVFRHETPYGPVAYTVSGLRKRMSRQLGSDYIKPHAWRHSAATLLLYQGMDLRSLQTFLGHSNIQTTMLYTHITDGRLRESYMRHWPSDRVNVEKLVDK